MREWQSLWLSVARNSDTLNLLVVEPGLVSWCWPWRLEAGVFHHTAFHQQSGSRPSSKRRVDPASTS